MSILTEICQVMGATTKSPVMWLYAFSGSLGVVVLWKFWKNKSLFSVPTYGGIVSFSSTLSMRRLGAKGREECMKAYAKNPITIVPITDGWGVLTHSKYVDEISRAPDEVLSFIDAASEPLQMKYTFGPRSMTEHYHIQVIRNQLTRHLSVVFPDVLDETMQAVTDYVGPKSKEWNTVQVIAFTQKIVFRASNRVFLGEPLCRNEDWMALMISIATDTMLVSKFINRFPAFLRPLAGWYSSPAEKNLDAAVKIAGPFVEERLASREYNDSDDYISWLISGAPDHERNVRDIIGRVILTNFASIHTTSAALTNSLYWLLARPQHVDPLLQEIKEATTRLGWRREAIGAMPKLDSFLKECMRISPFDTHGISRKVVKPFKFSNGLEVPVGMTVSAHQYATHHDENLYPHAEAFDGFRFVQPSIPADADKEKAGRDSGVKGTMYTTSPSYLVFGHGRHACPGRFFASTELKLMLAYLIANYEMKWPDEVYHPSVPGYTEEGYRPPDNCHVNAIFPDRNAKMMIRKRVASEAK